MGSFVSCPPEPRKAIWSFWTGNAIDDPPYKLAMDIRWVA